MNDFVLLGVFPYMALVVFFLVTIQRYRLKGFSYSSLSSQFLENQHHFWGSVPFHYGILVVLFGHILGFLMPQAILFWNAAPLRLLILEVTGIAFAVLTLVGLVNIVVRRVTNRLARRVTTRSDLVVYLLLLVQVVSGIGIAVFELRCWLRVVAKPLPHLACWLGNQRPRPRPDAINPPGLAVIAVSLQSVAYSGVAHALVTHVD